MARGNLEFAFPNGLKPEDLVFRENAQVHGIDIHQLSLPQLRQLFAEVQRLLQMHQDTLQVTEFSFPTLPSLVFAAGDFHFGSASTNLEMLEDFRRKILAWENTYLVLLGDEIEGRGKYHTSDVRAIPVNEQIALFRDWLRPIYEAGKVICAVGEYDGHVGWVVDKEGGMKWQDLFGDMTIPVVGNAQLLRLMKEGQSGDEATTVAVAHKSGGRSKHDPTHGLKGLIQNTPASVALAGHTHEFGQEVITTWNPDGGVRKEVMLNSGTVKGVGIKGQPDVLDTFGVRNAWKPPSPLGSGVIFHQPETEKNRAGGSIEGYPVANPEEGLLLLAALQLLEETEAQGITDEIVDEIRFPTNQPASKYFLRHILSQSIPGVGQSALDRQKWTQAQERMARRLRNKGIEIPDDDVQSEWFHEPYVPVYRRMVIRFDPDELPFALHPISHLRLGVANFRKRQFESYFEQLDKPWELVLWLRGLIDDELGGLASRMDHLEYAQSLMDKTAGRNIALLIDGALRRASWKRAVGGVLSQDLVTARQMKRYGPVAPATFLSKGVGVPLVANRGLIEMRIGHNRNWWPYIVGVMDKLFRHGSLTKPIWGLQRSYDFFSERPSLVTGGHMPLSGSGKKYDRNNPNTHYPTFVAPGWWGEFNAVSKGDVIDGGPPEHAVIIAPFNNRLLSFPTQGRSEYDEIMKALTLQLGLIKDPKIENAIRSR